MFVLNSGDGGVHHSPLSPRGPGTTLALTCIKSECPAQARMGGAPGIPND